MGYLRFQRRLKVCPGPRLNFSKGGVSTSIGARGAWYTVSKKGTRATVGLPGTGLFYTDFRRHGHQPQPQLPLPSYGQVILDVIIAFSIFVALVVLIHL